MATTINELVGAVQSLNAEDGYKARLSLDQWRLLGSFLTRYELAMGVRLINQGDTDRAMYFIQSGAFQVYCDPVEGTPRRVAILRPGAVVGEPSLFSERSRMAHVDAMMPSIVWALATSRFEELALRVPELALEVMRAAGAVMATRMRMNLERGVPMS